MHMNPYLNAAGAALYIVLIVNIMHLFERFAQPKDTIWAPMTMLSLFVLSAAVMGFLFVYKPLTLYIDGQKQEAVLFFGKTVAVFALCVFAFAAALLLFPY